MDESGPAVTKNAVNKKQQTASASPFCAGLGGRLDRTRCCSSTITAGSAIRASLTGEVRPVALAEYPGAMSGRIDQWHIKRRLYFCMKKKAVRATLTIAAAIVALAQK